MNSKMKKLLKELSKEEMMRILGGDGYKVTYRIINGVKVLVYINA